MAARDRSLLRRTVTSENVMATELAPVTPSVLRWARESIGASVEEAAKRAAVTGERILAWEAGEAEPTLAKLRALAGLYQRPLSIFFLPEPPKTFDALKDFRRLPGQLDHAWSRPLHKVYRRAAEQQEVAAELAESDGETLTLEVPAVGQGADPEAAAVTVRAALGVSLEQQFAWTKPDEALKAWIAAVEGLGVLVLRTSDVAIDEMRGFSMTGSIPVVVINALDSSRGQIFTLLHEFAHLMLREGGLCDLLGPDTGSAGRVEMWCNATAAAVLMPASSFVEEDGVSESRIRVWSDEELAELSGKYSVSREAVLRRLVTLKRASEAFYRAKREEFLAAYQDRREEERARRRDSTGGPPPYRMVVRDRGRPYVRLVLDAYHREVITPSSLSALLGMKLRHLASLERELESA